MADNDDNDNNHEYSPAAVWLTVQSQWRQSLSRRSTVVCRPNLVMTYGTTNLLERFGHLQRLSFNDHSLSLPSRLVLLPSLHPSSGTLFLLTLDLQTVSHVLNADWNQSFLQLLTPPRTVQCHRSALIRVFMRLIALLLIVLVVVSSSLSHPGTACTKVLIIVPQRRPFYSFLACSYSYSYGHSSTIQLKADQYGHEKRLTCRKKCN